jgi:hypothetical protein
MGGERIKKVVYTDPILVFPEKYPYEKFKASRC